MPEANGNFVSGTIVPDSIGSPGYTILPGETKLVLLNSSDTLELLLVFVLATVAVLVVLTLGVGLHSNTILSSGAKDLNVAVVPTKSSYILGEVVTLDVSVTNSGSSSIFLRGSDARSGYLQIYIASKDSEFKQYVHPGWIQDKRGAPLGSGQTQRSQATLLWNSKPKVSHLNRDAAQRVTKSRIVSDYDFKSPEVIV